MGQLNEKRGVFSMFAPNSIPSLIFKALIGEIKMSDKDLCWPVREMARARVTHGKERISLQKALGMLVENSGLSYSAALGNATRQAVRRIFSKEEITSEDIIAGHIAATVERIKEAKPGLLLLPSDTTEFDFTHHPSTRDLGPLHKKTLGFLSHEAIALSDTGMLYGVLHLDMWKRTEIGTRDKRRTRPYTEKESFKWARVLASIEERLPKEQEALLIQDREADIFAFVAQPRRNNIHLLIRASEPRRVEVELNESEAKPDAPAVEPDALAVELDAQSGTVQLLFDAIAQVAPSATYTFAVPRRPDQDPREAAMQLRFCPMTLLAPLNRHKDDPSEPQPVWVVQVREPHPPEGVSPVQWTLISTMPVTTVEQARAMVVRYSQRWLIERLHYTLKSGCNVERLQLEDFDSLTKAIALYFIVAWRLLHLTYMARVEPTTPASQVLSQDEITVLTKVSGHPVDTVSKAVLQIAKLGGYTYYKRAKPPGVKVLWLGWRKLDVMVLGYKLAMPNIRH
jgi:hypothetical protein